MIQPQSFSSASNAFVLDQPGPSRVRSKRTRPVRSLIDNNEKRKRRNLRMRKLVAPKTAVMMLNEVVKSVKYQFIQQQVNPNQIVARVEVNNVVFEGVGSSKGSAKQDAAENAIKYMFQAKILANFVSQSNTNSQAGTSYSNVATEPLDTPGTYAMKVDLDSEEMTIPWAHLASFGLYKLICNWNEQDSGNPKTVLEAQVKHGPMKRMPANPSALDPVMLLNDLQPGIKYVELKRQGKAPNEMFTMTTIVDGIGFMGTALSKKGAKKLAAKAALTSHYHVKYDA